MAFVVKVFAFVLLFYVVSALPVENQQSEVQLEPQAVESVPQIANNDELQRGKRNLVIGVGGLGGFGGGFGGGYPIGYGGGFGYPGYYGGGGYGGYPYYGGGYGGGYGHHHHHHHRGHHRGGYYG